MSSFRKVKSMCKGYDWRVVAEALKDSNLLEVNDDGSKVRRKIAVPIVDETRPARTLVAFAHHDRVPSMSTELIETTFSTYGPIAAVKLIQPGEQPEDTIRKVLARHPKAKQFTCAAIEFERSESATKALNISTSDFEVVLLKSCLKAASKGLLAETATIVTRDRRTFSESELQKRQPTVKSEGVLSWRDRSQPSQPAEPLTKPRSKSLIQGQQQTRLLNEAKCGRLRSATVSEPKEPETRPRRFTFSESLATNHVCAIRQPRGPDGTRGFHRTACVA